MCAVLNVIIYQVAFQEVVKSLVWIRTCSTYIDVIRFNLERTFPKDFSNPMYVITAMKSNHPGRPCATLADSLMDEQDACIPRMSCPV